MTRQLDYSRQAARFLHKVPAKHRRQLVTKILSLASDPYPQDSAQLAGFPFRRADAGEYRIIYDPTDEVLLVVLVGKRNDAEVYRRLKRQIR